MSEAKTCCNFSLTRNYEEVAPNDSLINPLNANAPQQSMEVVIVQQKIFGL
jgi:hypothetical protein